MSAIREKTLMFLATTSLMVGSGYIAFKMDERYVEKLKGDPEKEYIIPDMCMDNAADINKGQTDTAVDSVYIYNNPMKYDKK